jgi:hypothetical protein
MITTSATLHSLIGNKKKEKVCLQFEYSNGGGLEGLFYFQKIPVW